MILKGSARAGAMDLALHLNNALDNETVTIAEMRGMVADNLYEGFREWSAICSQSKTEKPFYSLSINPDPSQRHWGESEWETAIAHIEAELGFAGQPRAIVFHEKQGEDGNVRKHAHVVWSRIKTDNGQLRAIHLSQDYYRLKRCAKELAETLGLDIRYDKSASQSYDHAKSHGPNRDPASAEARKETLSKLWQASDSASAFVQAAAEAGYVIARGERRALVVVDANHQIHALARQIDGVKTKDVKARLGDPERYPDVEEAKQHQTARKAAKRHAEQRRLDLNRQQKQMAKLRRMAQRADRLHLTRINGIQIEERNALNLHRREGQALGHAHRFRETKRLRRRADKRPKGRIKKLCDAVGLSGIMNWLDGQENTKQHRLYLEEKDYLRKRHAAELARLARKKRYLAQQEKREARSIERIAKKISLSPKEIERLTHNSEVKKDQAKTAFLRLA